MNTLIKFLFITSILLLGCKSAEKPELGHKLSNSLGKLKVEYHGEVDAVQFKMFQGVEGLLYKKSSNHFEGEFNVKNLNDAIFTYEIIVSKKDSSGEFRNLNYGPRDTLERFFIWCGKNQNVEYNQSKTANKNITKVDLESKRLKATRTLLMYKPSQYDKNTPIIYMADGQIVEEYAPYIDTLIKDGKIEPIILVGVYSSDEYRYEEYVDHHDGNENFAAHQNFFYKEVLKYVEDSITNWSGKRYIYGFSNGGAFCMHAGINYPDKFEEVIAFSTADYISEFFKPIEIKNLKYPKFYMGVGIYEDGIYKSNVKFAKKLKSKRVNVTYKEFSSGHDSFVWKIEFLEYLLKRFKK